jgi:hypothetical protein
MKRLLLLVVVAAGAVAAVRAAASPKRRARLRDRLAGAVERCPPMAMMSALRRQNDEVLGLLREQNALLRQRPAPEPTAQLQPAQTV